MLPQEKLHHIVKIGHAMDLLTACFGLAWIEPLFATFAAHIQASLLRQPQVERLAHELAAGLAAFTEEIDGLPTQVPLKTS